MEKKNEEKTGFRIICNKCGSEDVSMWGTNDYEVEIVCNNCDNESN